MELSTQISFTGNVNTSKKYYMFNTCSSMLIVLLMDILQKSGRTLQFVAITTLRIIFIAGPRNWLNMPIILPKFGPGSLLLPSFVFFRPGGYIFDNK
ncbi:hypothetical protein DERF_001504 [Dermatophagoides farinae]|uniref:Uncharacterized protein n=1 Tax=Dermatophagoides farinae TaxID=6954 RepID=A0A922I9M8_DERFA|nr:hypothetical protein DERF_001504 [Dermatophagoides farinae]